MKILAKKNIYIINKLDKSPNNISNNKLVVKKTNENKLSMSFTIITFSLIFLLLIFTYLTIGSPDSIIIGGIIAILEIRILIFIIDEILKKEKVKVDIFHYILIGILVFFGVPIIFNINLFEFIGLNMIQSFLFSYIICSFILIIMIVSIMYQIKKI